MDSYLNREITNICIVSVYITAVNPPINVYNPVNNTIAAIEIVKFHPDEISGSFKKIDVPNKTSKNIAPEYIQFEILVIIYMIIDMTDNNNRVHFENLRSKNSGTVVNSLLK